MEGKTQAGNYLLKGFKGQGKGKVRNTAIPPNQLKRYIARSQNIPSNSDSDETIEIDVVREIPGHMAHRCTMEAAEILATLAAGDPDWLPDLTVPTVSKEEPEDSPLEVLVALAEVADAEIPDDTSADADAEIPGHTNVLILGHTSEESPIIAESSSSNSPMFDDATLEEVDIDLLIHGVKPPEPIKFRPLTLFCRKPAGLQLGVHVGRRSGLRQVKLPFTGEGLNCSDNFIEHNILGDGSCFFRTISYLLLGQEVKHDVIGARIVDYIMDPNNLFKLRSYIPQHYPSGAAYIQGEAMADLTTWATEVKLFACAQLSGKDVVCYCQGRWLRYSASGSPRRPTRNAFFISNKRGNHFNPVIGMHQVNPGHTNGQSESWAYK